MTELISMGNVDVPTLIVAIISMLIVILSVSFYILVMSQSKKASRRYSFFPFDGQTVFNWVDGTYESVFTDDEKNDLVASMDPSAFDGQLMRLEGLHKIADGQVVDISETSFFELLTSNLLMHGVVGVPDESLRIANKFRHMNRDINRKPPSSVIGRSCFANGMAVSMMIEDTNNLHLVSRRAKHVLIDKGFYNAPVVGTVKPVDFKARNPFAAAAARKAKEQTLLNVNPDDISIEGILIGARRLQPIVLCSVTITPEAMRGISDRSKTSMMGDVAADYFCLDDDGLIELAHGQQQKIVECAKYQFGLHVQESFI